MSGSLLEVDDLEITYHTSSGDLRAVTDASFSIGSSEYFGLVGESGCGKSTLAHAVVNALDANGEVTGGTVTYKGEEVQHLSEREYNEQIRWKEIAVIPQSAMNSLDPLSRVSEQAVETAQAHTNWSKEQAIEKLKELFDVVGLPQSRVRDYPHQFSGGMKQRAIIAFSLLLEPSLIIADEPTTALDVIMQDQFLKYLDDLREIRDFSLLFITHDIAVIFEMCDSMAVMHGGQIAELGSTEAIFDESRHPYTILLQRAFPDIRFPNRKLEGIEGSPPPLEEEVNYCTFADRCPWAQAECRQEAPPLEAMPEDEDHQVSCIRSNEMETLAADYLEDQHSDAASSADAESGSIPIEGSAVGGVDRGGDTIMELQNLDKYFTQNTNIVDAIRSVVGGGESNPVRAVDNVTLELKENEVQGVIGESGCGKSTLLRTLMGRYEPTGGEILFDGDPVSEFTKEDWKDFRQRVQIILQDPFNTLNPHFSVRDALMEPLQIHGREANEERILEMLEQVQLTPAEDYIDRGEGQLSGGEKQRVSIARALILEPEIVLADEPVSMLDVSTQASILDLLSDLTEQYGVSMLYISHDLSTVSYVCDSVNVMYLGRIIESAPTMELLNDPKHPYTRSLLDAIPVPDPHYERPWAELPGMPGDATNLPTGCRFKDRCPERMDVCDRMPVYESLDGSDHRVACHLHHDVEEVGDATATTVSDGGEPR